MAGRFLFLRYAAPVLLTLGAVALAFALREGLQPDSPGLVSSPLFLIAVAVSAWYGGNISGLIAAGLSLLSLEYLFTPPIYKFDVGLADVPRLAVFLGASLMVSWLTSKRRQAETSLHHTHEKLVAARTIQQKLYPNDVPMLAGFDIAGATYPANTIGGDYFDYIPLKGGATGVVVGDVSGHGLGPSLLMAGTRAHLRALALTHDDIGQILTHTNRLLTDDTEEEFLTVFFASLDPDNRSFVYAGAGHEAYLFEPDGKVRRLVSTTLPLGIDEELVVPCAPCISLEPGQLFLLITDGLFETQSGNGELFGIQRCLDVVAENRNLPSKEINHVLMKELRRFAGGLPQDDDITLVTIKVQAAE